MPSSLDLYSPYISTPCALYPASASLSVKDLGRFFEAVSARRQGARRIFYRDIGEDITQNMNDVLLTDKSLEELEEIVVSLGEKKFRASQLY